MTKASPSNVNLVSFADKQEMFDIAQAQVDALEAQDCDYIIALTHLGVDPESEGRRSTELAAAVEGIDLIVDGHSHTVMDGGEKVGEDNGCQHRNGSCLCRNSCCKRGRQYFRGKTYLSR